MKLTRLRFADVLAGLMIVSAVMTLIGLWFLPECYHRNNSSGWPTTPGVVSSAALKTHLQKPQTTTSFRPFICYSYTVDGIPRASTRIDFADSVRAFRKEEALAWIDRNYPVGKQVTVFYDRKKPDLAVVVPGARELVVICWSFATTSAFCFAASLILWRRQKRKGVYRCEERHISTGNS